VTRVVVDTSVWSLALRRRQPQAASQTVQKLYALLQDGPPLVLVGIILQELLQGLRSQAQFKQMQRALAAFPLIEPTRDDYVDATRVRNLCAAKGVQPGTIDCLIAAVCLRHDCLLLTADADFQAIARHTALRLV
jgi:predicted nucleic acid-binding protein